ncbi:competence/damage-inducible protein A [Halobacteriales archaeon QS_4_69_34]|nr:MAG: competence/damage-inducible protein A [Halobacteriales archaeon QS_4_69_34]
MQVALLTIGDELLAGDTENTNATWLARRLSERGVVVKRILVVPDDEAAIARKVREYAAAFDAVLLTGGLGGTPDDVTMTAVARAFDRSLAVNEAALEDVEATLERVREAYPDIDVDPAAEASIPAGARALPNETGLSPGCVLENVYVFPGIPEEMRPMFERVETEFAGESRSRSFHTATPEGDLVGTLTEARERFDLAVGCYPDRAARRNRIKVVGEDDARLDEATAWLKERVTVVEDDPEQ